MESNADGARAGKAVPAGANRWTMRDVMPFVIFNIVIIMVTMIVKMAEDAVLSPQNTFFVGSWLFPLVSTPFYLVMADRIGKRGVLSGSILLFGIQMACQMTFTSIGNAKASIIVAVTRKFILLLPLIYIMPHIFTADQTSAVYMAEPIADFLAICFTSILFRFEFKKALAR